MIIIIIIATIVVRSSSSSSVDEICGNKNTNEFLKNSTTT